MLPLLQPVQLTGNVVVVLLHVQRSRCCCQLLKFAVRLTLPTSSACGAQRDMGGTALRALRCGSGCEGRGERGSAPFKSSPAADMLSAQKATCRKALEPKPALPKFLFCTSTSPPTGGQPSVPRRRYMASTVLTQS